MAADPKSEKRLFLLSLDIYVPRDERFGNLKFSDFLAYAVKSLVQVLVPEIMSIGDKTFNEFDTLEDVLKIYDKGIVLPKGAKSKIKEHIPWEIVRELLRKDAEHFLKFPVPDVIKGQLTSLSIYMVFEWTKNAMVLTCKNHYL